MIPFLILLGALFVIVVGVELLSRAGRFPLELTRKTTHILTGVSVAVGAWYVPHNYLLLLSVLFILVIAVSRSRGIFRSIHDSERSGIGELWYPIGILLAVLLFSEPSVLAYSLLILAVSDGFAGLIGKLFGKTRVPFITPKKTYLGSGVFFVTAFVLGLTVLSPWLAALAALYLMFIELLSFKGLDNLILPLAAGVIALSFA